MSDAARARLILLFGLVTYGMGQSLLYVIFGPLARDIGLAEWQFGVLIAASNVAIVICSPLWGRASESLGRKTVYLLGMVGFAAGYAGLAFGIQAGLLGWLAPMKDDASVAQGIVKMLDDPPPRSDLLQASRRAGNPSCRTVHKYNHSKKWQ